MKFLALSKRNFLELIRDPLTSLLGILFPAILLVMFALINTGASAKVPIFEVSALIPGIIIFGFCLNLIILANLICKDKDESLMARFQTLPLKSGDFILGYTLPFLAISAIQIVLTFAIGFALGLVPTWGILISIPLLLFFSLFFISIGIILGVLCSSNLVLTLGNLFIFLFTFLSGVWVDLNWIGGLKSFAYALPFAHSVSAGRELIQGAAFNYNHLYFIIGYTLLFLAIAILTLYLRLKGKQLSKMPKNFRK